MPNKVPLFRKASDGQMIPGRIVDGFVDLSPYYNPGNLVASFNNGLVDGYRIYENYWQNYAQDNGNPPGVFTLPAQTGKRYVITGIYLSCHGANVNSSGYVRIQKTTGLVNLFVSVFRGDDNYYQYSYENIALFGDLSDGLTIDLEAEAAAIDFNRFISMQGVFIDY